MDDNRNDFFAELTNNADKSEQDLPEQRGTEEAKNPINTNPYPTNSNTQADKTVLVGDDPSPDKNGCTYAYGRAQQPVANTPPPVYHRSSTYSAPSQPNGNAPYQAAYSSAKPYTPSSQQPTYASSNQKPAQPDDQISAAKKSNEKKDRKQQKNRMSVGQLFLCLALCLVVGCVSGFVSSTTAAKAYVDSYMATMTTAAPSTTASYNVNIYEQPADPTVAPSTQAPATSATPAATASASDIYKQNVNAVVNITAQGYTTVDYGFFFGSQKQEFVASGTGFFLTADGYVLTNYHVVENATTLTVTDYDGAEYSATLVGHEASNDIAVLKVNGTFEPVQIGESDQLEVGDTILIIGNALGELQYTLTQGVVSYLQRAVTTETGTVINMFQTDAAINSGNSGGPVFNAKGEVVGIASAKYASSTIEGLGFCIPIDDVKQMINDIINVGYVTGRPSIGVSLYTNTSTRNGLPKGCYVVAIGDNSAADKVGIDVGDVITGINGTTVLDVDDVGTILNSCSAGDTIQITLYDASAKKTVTVNLTLDESTETEPRTDYTNVFDY